MSTRTVQAKRQISEAKKKSRGDKVSKLIVKTRSRREFFRFENGELVEYDLTRYKGKDIELSPAELDGMQQFFSENPNTPE